MESNNWVRTDEAEDVAGSIRHILRCWPQTSEDPQTWKWIALAIHSALQGACVCHLTTTARPFGAVTERNAAEWSAYFSEPEGKPPETQLMALPDLLKEVRKSNSAGNAGDGTSIRVNDSELQWLQRFHKQIRNQFIHFAPMGWSIETSGLAGLAHLASRIIGEVLDKNWGFRHKDEDWCSKLRADLTALTNLK